MDSSRVFDFNENVYQQILEAAFKRFGHYGYNKTTMAEIAEDTGMSAANLYRYFENKQEIAVACANRCICQHIDLLRAAVREPKLSATAQLENYVMTMLIDCHETFSNETKINEVVTFITNERSDLVYQKIDAQQALIAEILAHGNQTGEFDVNDVIATARAVHSTLVVFGVPLFMSLYPLDEFRNKARDVVKLLLYGLNKR
jgi:AcrR family transcriptional regulator